MANVPGETVLRYLKQNQSIAFLWKNPSDINERLARILYLNIDIVIFQVFNFFVFGLHHISTI